MNIQGIFALLFVLLGGSAALAQQEIPAGTVIPIMLNSTISPQKSKPGQTISGRVMQDVPLPKGMKIHAGARMIGHVVAVQQGNFGNPARISFAFDQLRFSKQIVPIKTDLRAVAGMTAVEGTRLPLRGMGEGESWDNRTTVQVGGDVVYWGGGPVMGPMGIVGKPVTGTDSQVLGKVTANPDAGCRGEIEGPLRPQALWVFSSNACGAYDLPGVTIMHAGRKEPLGVIELASKGEALKVPSGSGMLLRAIGGPE